MLLWFELAEVRKPCPAVQRAVKEPYSVHVVPYSQSRRLWLRAHEDLFLLPVKGRRCIPRLCDAPGEKAGAVRHLPAWWVEVVL